MTDVEIGRRLRDLRRSANLSQLELAKASGFSQTSIWRFETGRAKLTTPAAQRICDALQVPLESLFSDEPTQAPYESADRALYWFRQLSEPAQETAFHAVLQVLTDAQQDSIAIVMEALARTPELRKEGFENGINQQEDAD